jgi:hypothetical protein
MTEHRPQEEDVDEGLPLPLDERDAPQFATVQLVVVQRGEGGGDAEWHDEMQEGMVCPVCVLPKTAWDNGGRRKRLKRWHRSVHCEFCHSRWWSRKPGEM